MIFDVLRVQLRHIELLQEADHLRSSEITERVAREAQTQTRHVVCGWLPLRQGCETPRRSKRARGERTGTQKIATGECALHNNHLIGGVRSDMRFPALLILACPHLHRFWIVL